MTQLLGAPLMLGNHECFKYKDLRIWAERGLVRIEDARDNSYEILSVREAAERALALHEMLERSRKIPEYRKYFDQISSLQTFIENIVQVCQKAKEQGQPSDDDAVRTLAARQPLKLSVPADIAGF